MSLSTAFLTAPDWERSVSPDGISWLSRTARHCSRECFLWFMAFLCMGPSPLPAASCTPLSRQADVLHRVRERLGLPADAALSVEEQQLVGNTCYRYLRLRSTKWPVPIELYVSPDQRFISAGLSDLDEPISVERARLASIVQRRLLVDRSPQRGPAGASVKVVVFADFECGYCKLLNDTLASMPEDLRSRIVIIHKQFPLPIHPWARDAAVFTSCAALQDEAAFWQVSDYLFREQGHLTAQSIREGTPIAAVASSSIDMDRIRACVATGAGARLVDRDQQLGRDLRVDATPTVFVNGYRVGIPHTIEDVRRLVDQFE